MAEIAAAFGEQPARCRIVHVDPVAVLEREENVAQRVAGARLLAHPVGEGLGVDRVPVDRRRIDLRVVVAPAREDLEALIGERIGVAPQQREVFVARDRLRHGPVRIGLEAVHGGLDLGRGMLGRADDHLALEGGLAVVHEHHRIVAGVHEDIAPAEVLGQPAPAFEIGHDLLDAFVERRIERTGGIGADHAVDRQALGFLIGLHHGCQRIVVVLGCARGGRHGQFELCQPLAQHRHPRIGHAGLERIAAGHRRIARGGALLAQCRERLLQRRIVALGRQVGQPRGKIGRFGRAFEQIGALGLALLDRDVGVDAVGVDPSGGNVAGVGYKRLADQLLGALRIGACLQGLFDALDGVPGRIEAVLAAGADRLEQGLRARFGDARSRPQRLFGTGRRGSQHGSEECQEGDKQGYACHVRIVAGRRRRLTRGQTPSREWRRAVAVLQRASERNLVLQENPAGRPSPAVATRRCRRPPARRG